MKILLYNWAHDFDAEKRGGGVRIYQENVIKGLTKISGVQVHCLYSGLAYSFFRRSPYIKKLSTKVDGVEFHEIVNSEVMAPAHHDFGRVRGLFAGAATTEAVRRFLVKQGPFDVVHFNNLEGLPVPVLALKSMFPGTKFIYSLHNYYFTCPQVNLWKNESAHCDDYDGGRACSSCVTPPKRRDVLDAHRLAFLLKTLHISPKSKLFRFVFKAISWARTRKFAKLFAPLVYLNKAMDLRRPYARRRDRFTSGNVVMARVGDANIFSSRRRQMIEALNSNIDLFLAVSRQTARIAGTHGLQEEKTKVSYIGTAHAETFRRGHRKTGRCQADFLTLCYMGYMRRDKGFYFFLDFLEFVPMSLRSSISVKIVAPLSDPGVVDRLNSLVDSYHSVELINGYTHTELDEILREVDLGIVPVLWEDNLPQVAIEFVSRGVPILTSDRGGAQELGQNPEFVFKAGSLFDFYRKLSRIVNGKVALGSFWSNNMDLVDMQYHVDELMLHYKSN